MRNVALVLFLLLGGELLSQVTVQSFAAVQTDWQNVKLTWIIGPGNTCADLQIQYSEDSVSFSTVYEYPGICGDANFPQQYTWSHNEDECGGRRYYRIVSQTGGLLAETRMDFVCYGPDGINVHYNYLTSLVEVAANVPANEVWFINIYNLSGQLALSAEISDGNGFVLWKPAMNGIYIYEVRNDQLVVKKDRLLISGN